jgi:hypothetical protein
MKEHILRPYGDSGEDDVDDEEFLLECDDVVFDIVDEGEDPKNDGNRFD